MGGVNYVNPHNPQPTILDYNALSNKNIEMQLNSTSLSKLNQKIDKKLFTLRAGA